ncbi:hypothetical protein F2Q68_00020535 [Brassica cretica]|uniref:Uncharacterized protein n=1 Tax=Brassica cretica TaxID=69181 RepID=A0A8S9FVC4_BRACR|nr:hypothetical protein F2Q68_00020535 [Brassica cretica]
MPVARGDRVGDDTGHPWRARGRRHRSPVASAWETTPRDACQSPMATAKEAMPVARGAARMACSVARGDREGDESTVARGDREGGESTVAL